MAKKQSLSYGPNMGLIAGEAQVAKSEAGLSNSVGAFAQGFMGVFGAIKKDEEEQAAKMEAYSAQVPSLDQIHFMKDESNKQIVRTFLNKQRDEYSRLAEIFDKTKDRDVKDKMEAIKFSLVNLNDQIKVFNQDKADYITAFDEGQLAKGKAQPNGAYFTDVYTNNSQFGVGDNGDLSFTVGGQTSLFKDRAGTWNPRNNISETFFLDNFQREIGSAQKGGKFIESTTYNRLFNNLRSTGNDGLQALITQDLVGDSSNDTFEQQFASGTLDTKIYAGYENYKLDKSDPRFKEGEYEYDTDFMFKNENGDKVRGLVAQYFTNVTKTGHENEFKSKEEKTAITKTNPYGFTTNKIRIGPTQGGGSNTYQNTMNIDAATVLLNKIEQGIGFPFGSNNYNYLFDEKTGEGAWHEFKPGEAINKPTETSFIGSAKDLESSIFRTNLPQFQGLETTVDNSKSLSSEGVVIGKGGGNLNPFSVGEIPQDFINAVGEDDNNVIDYIRGLKIPNLTISKSGNLDTVIISLGEKTNKKVKTFTVDPNIVSDVDRATEIWNWMKSNYSLKKKFD